MNKLVLHPNFKETIKEIGKVNINITQNAKVDKFDFSSSTFPPNGRITPIEGLESKRLDASNGLNVREQYTIGGYDESKLQYFCLEGSAYFTTHALVVGTKLEYLPVNFMSFYFYTKSEQVSNVSDVIKYSLDSKTDANYDYVKDRNEFLVTWAPENSILLIDGPLIGGNISSYTVTLTEKLHRKNIIPIFFVKNSDSNLVTENVSELQGQYNSDMHWSYNYLKPGSRTGFILYKDEHNPKNAKVFCYLKAFNLSPQRLEMHAETYKLYRDHINNIMDLIYYLLLVHGDKKNPQVRLVAIAENYARDVLKMINPYATMKSSGLVPTMNEERFGG